MTQAQFDAFVLMCYNCGVGAFSRPAVVAKCFNTGEDREMRVWWLKSFVTVNGGKEPLTGLVNRRKHELRIFTDGDY
jgi:GH24 family phage-related lysozyme (muramidase)